eukprot:403347270
MEERYSPSKQPRNQQLPQQFYEDLDEVQYQSELVSMLQGQGSYPNQMMGQDYGNQYVSQLQYDSGFDDSQFQPPIDNFGIQSDIGSGQVDQNFIDQKIMQNIQKYLTGFMGSQFPAPSNQPPLNIPQQQSMYSTNLIQDQQLPLNQTLISEMQKMSMNNTQKFNETQPLNLQHSRTQSMNVANPIVNMPQVTNQQNQIQQFLKQQQQTMKVQNEKQSNISTVQSDEFILLKQVIDGLNTKIDSMQKLTENLKLTIDQKDREIQKIRSIYSMRGKKSEIVEAKNKKIKRDMGIQTVINLQDNKAEYETFSYLYDKDQDLIRSEKGSLLKYLRKEVVQNQDFLDRINELENINLSLQDEIALLSNQLAQSKLIIQDNYAQQQYEKQELMKNKEEVEIQCQILEQDEFDSLNSRVQELEELLKNEQQIVQDLESQVEEKQNELKLVKDSTNNSLFSENQNLRNQIKSQKQEIEQLNKDMEELSRYNQEWESECQKLKSSLDEKEKSYQEQISRIKAVNLQQLDKANQEKDRLSKRLEEKEREIWDQKAKIEQAESLANELEAQMDKKNKNKKKNECMECFKKEAELQTLNAKLLKLTNETTNTITELDRQVKQKESQIGDGQMLIKSLSMQLQENIQKGGDDPSVKAHISKLQQDNDEQSKLIHQLKTNMEKQAAQFMMQLIQQQPSNSSMMGMGMSQQQQQQQQQPVDNKKKK